LALVEPVIKATTKTLVDRVRIPSLVQSPASVAVEALLNLSATQAYRPVRRVDQVQVVLETPLLAVLVQLIKVLTAAMVAIQAMLSVVVVVEGPDPQATMERH
jgi:energy-converting hydrogenase Eha subunit A